MVTVKGNRDELKGQVYISSIFLKCIANAGYYSNKNKIHDRKRIRSLLSINQTFLLNL